MTQTDEFTERRQLSFAKRSETRTGLGAEEEDRHLEIRGRRVAMENAEDEEESGGPTVLQCAWKGRGIVPAEKG